MTGGEVVVKLSRRALLEIGWAVPATAAALPAVAQTGKASRRKSSPDVVGVLVDTTLCIGCRKCEEACNRRNRLRRPGRPFTDRGVFRTFRRPAADAFTVVNQFPGAPSPDQSDQSQTYAKL
jgi:formate dehydrogenase iron-sulfur subunit